MENITVEQAEEIIQSQKRDNGTELLPLEVALGRVLAEHLFADRDLPPFNRATMDGVGINYGAVENGISSFTIKDIQAAGKPPITISDKDECIEIMTGAALDQSVDTVIRYEDIEIENGIASIKKILIKKGQNIHVQGRDKKQGEIIAEANVVITPALMGLAASVGKKKLLVKKIFKIVIITTGDELVEIDEKPEPFQLRQSNGIMIQSVLKHYAIPADRIHLNDDFEKIKFELERCLKTYDVLLITGGVSMGKFDLVPGILNALGVKKIFHKVKQRPGKPFWFGAYQNNQLIFAFPGNPVSVFMCLHRYFIPWLESSLGLKNISPQYAVLQNDIIFSSPMQFFAQVKLEINQQGILTAHSVESNGSGDFSQLIFTDAFMELPSGKGIFKKGEVYKVWQYNF